MSREVFYLPRVLLVPTEAHKGGIGLGALVDDGGVLLVAEVEHPDRAIGGDGGEDADAAPGDVVHLLVVGDELGVDHLLLDVPDGAGGVDAGGADPAGLGLVPVEGGDGAAELEFLLTLRRDLREVLESEMCQTRRKSLEVARRSGRAASRSGRKMALVGR